MTFIRPAFATDYGQLISVWEAAVRATHDFLPEADIATLKSLILDQYFDAVSLYVARQTDGHIVGFCGALDGNLDMLLGPVNTISITLLWDENPSIKARRVMFSELNEG